ncbi:MAG: hypothetical protein WCE64_05225 [Bacteroidales bacterium]
MSGTIEGYNYDVFISYHRKDNKHDGWVKTYVSDLIFFNLICIFRP